MASYEITKSCGHVETEQIYGTNSQGQRAWQAEQMAKRPCTACLQAIRADLSARAAAVAEAAGWPTLTGSPAQTSWAQTVRADLIARLAAEIGDTTNARPGGIPMHLIDAVTDLYVTVALRQASAGWWIDQRTNARPARTIAALFTSTDRAALAALRQIRDEDLRDQDDDNTPTGEQGGAPTTIDLITALRAAGRTVREIAEMVAVSASTIYRWARGICQPRPTNAARLAAIAA